MHEQLAQEIKSVTETRTSTVYVCCCIDKGTATMTCHFEKSAFVPGMGMRRNETCCGSVLESVARIIIIFVYSLRLPNFVVVGEMGVQIIFFFFFYSL